MRRKLLVIYWRFGPTYRVNKGQILQVVLDCLIETSINNYQSTLRNIPEEPKSLSQRGERIKSRKMKTKEQDENRNTAVKQVKNYSKFISSMAQRVLVINIKKL